MKNIFKTSGFDTIIAKGTLIHGPITIHGTMVIDGEVTQGSIRGDHDEKQIGGLSALQVNGKLKVDDIDVFCLTVTGQVEAKEVRVGGTLAVKSGAVLRAGRIYYRMLVVEPDAVILAELLHFDYVSEGEQV